MSAVVSSDSLTSPIRLMSLAPSGFSPVRVCSALCLEVPLRSGPLMCFAADEVAREGTPANLASLHLEPMVDGLGHGAGLALATHRCRVSTPAMSSFRNATASFCRSKDGQLSLAGLGVAIIYEISRLHDDAA